MDVPMKRYEVALNALLERKGLKNEDHMNSSDLIELVMVFKGIVDVPDDPWVQLGMAISKMMECWWSESAVKFRELHNIREDLSSAVVIQSMVYGNRNVFSGTGLAYTRNPITGEREICGEYMPKSDGVDLLSGFRTPSSIMELFHDQPGTYEKLVEYCGILEKHFQDLQVRPHFCFRSLWTF
jgi:pyruvate,orthophosphate dikinase